MTHPGTLSRRTRVFSIFMAAALSAAANGELIISELDFVGNTVELVNVGGATVDASAWWWCNRVNGSPFYATVASASTIDVELSTATSLAAVAPGEILVLDIGAGFLPDPNGELGLYNTNSFGSETAIRDYVLWGANGIGISLLKMPGFGSTTTRSTFRAWAQERPSNSAWDCPTLEITFRSELQFDPVNVPLLSGLATENNCSSSSSVIRSTPGEANFVIRLSVFLPHC